MGLRNLLKETARALLARPEAPRAPAGPPAPPTVLPADRSADGFRAVAFSTQVAEGRAGTYPLAGTVIIAVFRREGRLWCIDNACAHEDGPVGEGAIAGCRVKCPYHDWEYDYTTGACLTDPERALATYAVREHGGIIWVGPRLTEGTTHRGGAHNDGLETIIR